MQDDVIYSIKTFFLFFSGGLALINPNSDVFTPLMYAATGMAVVLWFSIMLFPLVQVRHCAHTFFVFNIWVG